MSEIRVRYPNAGEIPSAKIVPFLREITAKRPILAYKRGELVYLIPKAERIFWRLVYAAVGVVLLIFLASLIFCRGGRI